MRIVLECFAEKVEFDEEVGCWLWCASVDGTGYGKISVNGRLVPAHRWSYEYFVEPIPVGLHLDHLCRVRRCVNPWHVEPVTRSENVLRGVASTRIRELALEGKLPIQVATAQGRNPAQVLAVVGQHPNQLKTHCPLGHEYAEENTYWWRGGRSRKCRLCWKIRRLEQKEAA